MFADVFQKFENKISSKFVESIVNNYGKSKCKKKENNEHNSVL